MAWPSGGAAIARWSRARPLLALELTFGVAATMTFVGAVAFANASEGDYLRVGADTAASHAERAIGLRIDRARVFSPRQVTFGWDELAGRLAERAAMWRGRCFEVERVWGENGGVRLSRIGVRVPAQLDHYGDLALQPGEAVSVIRASAHGAVAEVVDGHHGGTLVEITRLRGLRDCSPAHTARIALFARLRDLPVETPTL